MKIGCERIITRAFAAACLLGGPLTAPLFAAAGRSGGEFLRIVASPRAVAMGESGTGLYGDLLGALSLNPAALARTGYREAAFTYNSWLEGITAQQAAYAHPLGGKNGVLAGSLSMLSMDSIEGYNSTGGYEGKVNAGDMAIGLNYAVRLTGPWADRRLGLFSGIGIKYAREKLDTVSANTELLDAGLLWVLKVQDGTLGLGAAVQSLGSGFKFDSGRDASPEVLRAGAAYIILAAGDPLSVALDVKKPNDSGAVFSGGAEYLLKRIFALRAGYISDADLGSGLRFGGGVVLKLLQFDYALSNYGKFGSAHRFSLSYKFGKPVEITNHISPDQERSRWKTGRAREFMKDSRYYEAVLELNDALGLDPGNAEALVLMRRARSLMETAK